MTDASRRVVGVRCLTMAGAPAHVVREHRWLSRRVGKMNLWYRPLGKRMSRRLVALEKRYARPWTVRAERGVVVSAGGFAFDRDMVREHAPAYARGLPLGTLGDDGSGIRLGRSVGGAARGLERMSAWRFFTPPSALAKGLLLGPDGSRVCNESLYGATVAEHVIHEHGGQAFLLVDQKVLDEARSQVPSQTLWFQRLQLRTALGSARLEGRTVAEVLAKAGIDPAAGERSLATYNEVARSGGEDPMGKPADLLQPLETGPYSLVDISIRKSVKFPCPTMTLGGLVVDEDTGAVLAEDGAVVPGLFAAGRTAYGICSKSYVSGLSLADCVFSGRRAGRTAARATTATTATDNGAENDRFSYVDVTDVGGEQG